MHNVVSVIQIVVACIVICGVRKGACAGPEIDRDSATTAVLPKKLKAGSGDNDGHLSAEQLQKVQPLAALDARWMIHVTPSAHKSNLIGRPSRLVAHLGTLLMPFEDFVIGHAYNDGRVVNEPRSCGATIDQLVCAHDNPSVIACTLSSHEHEGEIMVAQPDGRYAEVTGRAMKIAPWRILLSPDGSRLVSCGDDQSMRLFDVVPGRTRRQIGQFPGYGFGQLALLSEVSSSRSRQTDYGWQLHLNIG